MGFASSRRAGGIGWRSRTGLRMIEVDVSVSVQNFDSTASRCATFVNPVIAMLLGVAVGGEVVTGFEWLAAGVVLVGLC